MTGVFRIASIHIYPMKAGRAVDLDESVVEPWGLAGDRRWLLADEDNHRSGHRRARLAAAIPDSAGTIRVGDVLEVLGP